MSLLYLKLLPTQVVYVMPSTSGRAASHPRRVDKLKFFHELKQLRDRLQLQKGNVKTMDAAYHDSTTGSDSNSKIEGSATNTTVSSTSSSSSSSVLQSTSSTGEKPIVSVQITGPSTSTHGGNVLPVQPGLLPAVLPGNQTQPSVSETESTTISANTVRPPF